MTPFTTDITDNAAVVDYILGDNRDKYSAEDVAFLERAYEFSRTSHFSQKRASGEPYILHPVEVTRIVAESGLDANGLAAALLHDTLEDCSVSHEQVSEMFNPQVADLVEGVTKISALQFGTRKEEQVENLRKMILAMARDIRVVIIKLADRLHNLRTLTHLAPEKRLKIARDTMDVYAPLANRLGMTRIKSELEDGSMYYLHPKEYKEIAHKVALKRAERESLVQKSIEVLSAELEEQDIHAEIKGRSKHLWSIYQKMAGQDMPFDQIHDLIGLRVICEDVPTCYEILGIVHKLWRPIPGRFKDYIAMPKENMYQSLHTSVVGLGGHRIEIQVRTFEMHRFAEEGIAAHWKYKEGVRGSLDLEEKLAWLRKLTDWLNDVRDPGEFMDALQKDVFSDTVFCFTPRGDVIELPAGATPLDFAYAIHTNVGESCTGAKVNHRIVPLRYTLHNGDFVEILTSKNGHPSPDWLDIVKTSRARTKIKHWLRTKNFHANVEKGRDLLARAVRARGITLDWAIVSERAAPALKSFKVQSFDELLGEIGFGGLLAINVVHRLFPESSAAGEDADGSPKPRKGTRENRRRKDQGVIVENLPSTVVRFGQCCSPVPGDPIVGFVTYGRGVTIHNRDCQMLANVLGQNGNEARLLTAEWDYQHPPVRRVTVRVECQDRKGLLADITSVMTGNNIFILESKTKSKADTAVLKFMIEVKDVYQLNNLFSQLRQVKGVTNVARETKTATV